MKQNKKITKRQVRKQIKHPPLAKRHVLNFVPALLIAASAFIFSLAPLAGRSGVLAYATSVSPDDLLVYTNSERQRHEAKPLILNDRLIQAAQAKANDMAARDYWSHETPDGAQPWTFIVDAGYQYKAAGENLAFGFLTSSETVKGWMNSPSHRDNLLNTAYSEAGFGIANSKDFSGNGEQTIVVAMYGAPLSVTVPVAGQTASEDKREAAPVVFASTSKPQDISRVQLLTSGNAAWSASLVVVFICALGLLWSMQRGLRLKKVLVEGEHFLLRHLHIDLTVLAFIYLGWVFVSRVGSVA